jgi:hypothetical protein
VGRVTPRPFYPRYSLHRRLGGPQSRFRSAAKEKDATLAANRTAIFQPVAYWQLHQSLDLCSSQYNDESRSWTTGVWFPAEAGICSIRHRVQTGMGPTQPPTQWETGTLSRGVKRPGREANHSPVSSVKVKNGWSCTSTPQYVFMAWYLVKHGDNFTLPVHLQCTWRRPRPAPVWAGRHRVLKNVETICCKSSAFLSRIWLPVGRGS